MAVCANCEHPIGFHGEEGCTDRSLGTCGCAWYESTPPSPLSNRPRRCDARYDHGDGRMTRCEIMETEATTHNEDHRGGGFSWTESVAVYPTVTNHPSAIPQAPASERQIGGSHYRKFKIQPWDIVDEYELSYYAGSALKYLLRAGHKGAALEDLKKCRHYLDKLIELEEAGGA